MGVLLAYLLHFTTPNDVKIWVFLNILHYYFLQTRNSNRLFIHEEFVQFFSKAPAVSLVE